MRARLPILLIGCAIGLILSAQYVSRNLSENLGSGALPGTCTTGDVIFRTDPLVAGLNLFGCTSLNTWTLLGDGGGAGVYEIYPDASAVPASGWSWDNQVAATENVDGLGRRTINTAVTTGGVTGRFRTMAASINYTVTMGLIFQQGISALAADAAGICVREAATTELVCFFMGIGNTNLGSMNALKRNSATSFNSSYLLVQNVHYLPLNMGWPLWLRIEDDGTNLLFSVSLDGENFVQYNSELRTDFLTADEVGFYTVLNSPGFLTLFSYEEI